MTGFLFLISYTIIYQQRNSKRTEYWP